MTCLARMETVQRMRNKKQQDLYHGKPRTTNRNGRPIRIGHIPGLTETRKARQGNDIGSNVGGYIRGYDFTEWVGKFVSDGFVLNVFAPGGEGSFLCGGEEEFEPSFGSEVLEGDGVEGGGGLGSFGGLIVSAHGIWMGVLYR